jgi:hypothetical protein
LLLVWRYLGYYYSLVHNNCKWINDCAILITYSGRSVHFSS